LKNLFFFCNIILYLILEVIIMKIGANKGTELVTLKKTEKPGEKSVSDKVSIGGNSNDESLMMADKLKQMKAGDAITEVAEAGCMAGATILGGAVGGGIGIVAGGVGGGFAAAALGAGGWGVFGAVVGGIALGGFIGAEIGAHSVAKDFKK
jgi:hypothetical protein